MLYSHIKSRYQHLSEQLSLMETRLQSLPDGKLICCKDGNKIKWYSSDGHTKTSTLQANVGIFLRVL